MSCLPDFLILTIIQSKVIDEADRLLAHSFQDWLAQVLAATRPPRASTTYPSPEMHAPLTDAVIPPSSIPYADAVAPAFSVLISPPPPYYTRQKESSCQKLLFSATLTQDPGKIAALELRNPKYFVVREGEEGVVGMATEKFSMPSTLVVRFSAAHHIRHVNNEQSLLRSI